jgi:drug/metabolite transporter (DMT)-like permease
MTSPGSAATPRSSSRRDALIGIGLMLLGCLLYSANDALGKWLLVTYSVWQMLLIRSVAALILMAPFIWRAGWPAFRDAPRPGLQIVRIVLSSLEVVMFFVAVTHLPLADTVIFYLAGPIYVTALSALLLGEKVGWRRWSAVLIGFAGVVISLRPSPATLTWPALIALAGSISFAFLMITTRVVRGTPDIVLASGQIIATFVLGIVSAPFAWKAAPTGDVLQMALLGVVAVTALLCVNRSLKLAPASVVVPYQYTLLVWATVFGYLVFGDVPTPHVIIGGVIIVAAGLFIFFREQRVASDNEPVTPPPT